MTRIVERRAFAADIEVRRDGDGVKLRGYAAVFDSEAHGEVVKPSAFNRTVAQRDDVRLLVNHDGVPLARTKSGTLHLSIDDRGLMVDADLDPSNPTVQELVSAMARGDIDQMSFAFEAKDAPRVDGVRELREVVLYDVSVVTYPWYEATSASLDAPARSALAAVAAGTASPEQRAMVRSLVDEAPAPAEEPVIVAPAEPEPEVEQDSPADDSDLRRLEAAKALLA